MNEKNEFDAVVVGSGPNGLSAAIVLKQAGLSVLLIEAKSTIGGGLRSEALTLPGYVHDVCSAVHPMAAVSPFFNALPLEKFGLKYIQPPVLAAHPFDNGKSAVLLTSVSETAASLGTDDQSYRNIFEPLMQNWPRILPFVQNPLSFPAYPFALAKFGLYALGSAAGFIKKHLPGTEAAGFFAGMAAHSMLPLNFSATSAAALVLMLAGHSAGWPIAQGGSYKIAQALHGYYTSIGGKTETGFPVKSIKQLPSSKAILFDVTPKQLAAIAPDDLPQSYIRRLHAFRYGVGVFKIDWALDAPAPFISPSCRNAGTVHLGNSFEEIARWEKSCWDGNPSTPPFVLFVQPTVFDGSRAPEGKHTAWAYCHVPNGSTMDMTEAIENQVERFAPGFRKQILARHTMNTVQVEAYNPNYIGGDIGGGAQTLKQLFARPVLSTSPYKTPAKGIYLCSSSTPPGGGVHGMCGYHAARRALRDLF